MTPPPRFVVELRPPRKGERYVGGGEIWKAETDYADYTIPRPRWVIVDPVPADPAKEP